MIHFRTAAAAAVLAVACVGGTARAQTFVEYDSQWDMKMIGVQAAYDRGYTGQGVVVGVLDSGANPNHVDLAPNLSDISLDIYSGGPVLSDPHGHGSHVAGTIAGARNGVGAQGVAYDARLAILRLLDADNIASGPDDAVATLLNYALDRGVRIFNNSWGGYFLDTDGGPEDVIGLYGEAVMSAYQRAVDLDAVMVWATGNESLMQPGLQAGLPYYFPAWQGNWLAVTAVDSHEELTSYANHCGLAAQWCLAAPGGELPRPGETLIDALIVSASNDSDTQLKPNAGTSMAAPHVTGAVAIARQMFPVAPAAGITRLVLATATDLGAPGVDESYGWGLLNLENMVSVLDAEAGSVFANGAWAADEGQTALIETLSGRLASGQGAGAWAAVIGAKADHDPSADAFGASSETYGLVGGYDVAATETTRIGVALSASRTDFDEDGIDNSGRVDDLTLAGYAAARKGVLFGEASAGFGYRDYSYNRRDILGASGTVLEAQGIEGRSTSDGWAAFADARLGAAFALGAAELRPFVHGRLMHQSIDAFDEAGADVFSQSVGKTELQRYEYGPGVQGVLDAGGGLRADLSVRYDFRSGDDDYAVPVSLMGSPVPARIGALGDGVTVNGGVEARLGDAWRASARGYWAGGDDRAAGGVSLGLSYTF